MYMFKSIQSHGLSVIQYEPFLVWFLFISFFSFHFVEVSVSFFCIGVKQDSKIVHALTGLTSRPFLLFFPSNCVFKNCLGLLNNLPENTPLIICESANSSVNPRL